MSEIINLTRIYDLMRMTCHKNNVSLELVNKVKLEWNDKFTRRMGDASHVAMSIRLSSPLFARATIGEQEDTVIHEMCHIVAVEKHGRHIRTHGGEWMACMINAGREPKRCHNVDRTGLKRTTKIHETKCGCTTHMVTARMFAKIALGQSRICSKCKGRLYIPGMK